MNSGLTFEYPAAWIIVCVLAGLVYAFGLYFKDKHKNELSQGIKILLGGLRFLVAAFLAFLLLSPYIKTSFTETQKPIVVLLQDNTSSINTVWGKEDSARYVADLDQLVSTLRADYEVKTFAFDDNLVESEEFGFDGKLTDMAGALEGIGNLFSGRNLGAVILASDGIYNKGNSPVYVNKSLSAPVFTLALGDTTPRKDLKIEKVLHNRLVYLGDKFKIKVDMRARHCGGANTRFTINHVGSGSSAGLHNEVIEINDKQFEHSVEVILEADKEGLQQYRIGLSGVEGEFTTSNNYTSIFVDVLKARQKITLIAQSPHPDLSAIKQAVESNKNYELEIFMARDFDEKSLREVNLAILHQLPSSDFPIGNILNALTENKTPTLFVLGSQTSVAAFNKAQSAVQIVQSTINMNEVQAAFDPDFSLYITEEQAADVISSLPPLLAPFGEYKVSPNSSVAVHQKIGSVVSSYPLLLFNEQLDMKQAVLAGEGIWRWRLIDYLNNKDHSATNELITKAVQYLAVKVDKRQFRVTSPKNIFTENESIELNAELYNDAYELINNPEATISIVDEDGKEFPYIFNKTTNAYILDAGSMAVGNYTFSARVNFNGKDLTHSGRFSVGPLQLESTRTTADHQLLFALSQQYDGSLFYPNQLTELAEAVKGKESIKPVLYDSYKVQSFINIRWILFILALLLGLEWFIRKYNGVY